MKKIFISLIFCFAISKTVAQDNPTIQATEEIPNWPVMLTNLNTTQITSGVLVDKVTTFSNLINYNTTESNLSGSEHFAQALSELYRASDQTRFVTLTELKNRTATTTANNSVDIGLINTTFQKLNFNEETPSAGGLLFSNGMFTAISGKPSFVSKKIMIAAPLKEIISGSSFTFNFNNNLIFSNATTSIKTLVVDFEDNTTATTIISNGAIVIPAKTVNYTESGMKALKFTVTFSDNSIIETYGKVYVNYVSTTQRLAPNNTNTLCYELLKDKGIFTSTISFQGYTESSPVYGKTEYTIFYGNGNNAKQMIKPIIIVDGFDPKDKRKVQDCDCELDPTCKLANSNIKFSPFTNPRLSITFNPVKHESLEDLMYYEVSPSIKNNVLTDLRAKGYDVIIINNPTYTSTNVAGQTVTIDGGADYIERNGRTLASYIQKIKDDQNTAGSTQQLVLIGPSMGGQITRYALAYMEKKFAEETNSLEKPKWKHNARLWVSVDSPHLGANIPVGAQANIWFFADRLYKESAKTSFYEELNSVAGKQQIISQFKNARETGFLNGNSFFTTYYKNLNTNGVTGSGGYPVTNSTFRKIAMVNGSLTGKKEASEQQSFLYSRVYVRGLWPMQNSTITLARFQNKFTPASGQAGTVFKGDGQNFDIGLNHWYINHPRYTLNVNNNSIKGSMDVVPGGYFKTAKILRKEIEDGASDAGFRSETRDYIENHSFISTFSALGHLYPNQNWSNPLNTNLTCPSNKQTPFDSYYGTANNTEHTSFTKESAAWLYKELDGIPQDPSFPIQPSLLTGASVICENTNNMYQFADICKLPSAVTWSVTPNLQIVSSTPYTVTVNQITNGEATITATFQNGQVVTKNIWVGNPSFNLDYSYVEQQPEKAFLNMVSDQPNLNITQQGITSTTFKGTHDGITYFNFTKLGLYGCRLNSYDVPKVIATATNACGTTTVELDWLQARKDSNSTNTTVYKVFPNPSNDIVTINLKSQNNISQNETTTWGELFDMMGQSKSRIKITNDKAAFCVQGLNKGIYILKIYLQNHVENHRIVVE